MAPWDAPSGVGNYWTSLDAWPTPLKTRFFLHSGGGLNQTEPTETASGSSSTYLYDPERPTPTIGGNNLMISCGPRDQTKTEKRDDVLIFTSVPFEVRTQARC